MGMSPEDCKVFTDALRVFKSRILKNGAASGVSDKELGDLPKE